MASPGFLQNGVSRHLFERWCDDARNGVIIAGYTVEGTLAHQLLEHPPTITCQDNVIKPRRCQIEHVSFSAHVDYNDNLRFIKEVRCVGLGLGLGLGCIFPPWTGITHDIP